MKQFIATIAYAGYGISSSRLFGVKAETKAEAKARVAKWAKKHYSTGDEVTITVEKLTLKKAHKLRNAFEQIDEEFERLVAIRGVLLKHEDPITVEKLTLKKARELRNAFKQIDEEFERFIAIRKMLLKQIDEEFERLVAIRGVLLVCVDIMDGYRDFDEYMVAYSESEYGK